jgi:uncharacterized protein (DUF488 family)
MTLKVYGIGYSGKDPEAVRRIAEALDAVVFDIRFSPRSRDPRWAGRNVAAALGAGRYEHVRALGNRNYKGGPVELVDFEAGLRRIFDSERPVILMCVCRDPATCHRTVVGRRLEEAGLEYTELKGPLSITDPEARRTRQLTFDL